LIINIVFEINNWIKRTYGWKFYRNNEKNVSSWTIKIFRSNIIYYFPSGEKKEKYIFKLKNFLLYDSLYIKNDISFNYALEDWDIFVHETNELLNSKKFYCKSDNVKSFVDLYNFKSWLFPLIMDKFYVII